MEPFKRMLIVAGTISLALALFQAAIGFSPSLSLYFGAPESLAADLRLLIPTSLFIAGVISVFGCYALSGAGYIRPLPWLRPVLVIISAIYIFRGLLLIPEILILAGTLDIPIPVAPRFVVFSVFALMTGVIYLAGTVYGWYRLPSKRR